jgi:hypothetical protein
MQGRESDVPWRPLSMRRKLLRLTCFDNSDSRCKGENYRDFLQDLLPFSLRRVKGSRHSFSRPRRRSAGLEKQKKKGPQ